MRHGLSCELHASIFGVMWIANFHIWCHVNCILSYCVSSKLRASILGVMWIACFHIACHVYCMLPYCVSCELHASILVINVNWMSLFSLYCWNYCLGLKETLNAKTNWSYRRFKIISAVTMVPIMWCRDFIFFNNSVVVAVAQANLVIHMNLKKNMKKYAMKWCISKRELGWVRFLSSTVTVFLSVS